MTVKEAIKKLYYDMRVRFLFVGCLNTLVGYLVDLGAYALLYRVFHVEQTVAIAVSPVIGTAVGAVHSYFWNKYFTFNVKKKTASETLRFALVYVVMYLVSQGIQQPLISFVFPEGDVYVSIAKFIATAVTVVLSWFGQKYFVFRRKSNSLAPQSDEDAQKKDSV